MESSKKYLKRTQENFVAKIRAYKVLENKFIDLDNMTEHKWRQLLDLSIESKSGEKQLLLTNTPHREETDNASPQHITLDNTESDNEPINVDTVMDDIIQDITNYDSDKDLKKKDDVIFITLKDQEQQQRLKTSDGTIIDVVDETVQDTSSMDSKVPDPTEETQKDEDVTADKAQIDEQDTTIDKAQATNQSNMHVLMKAINILEGNDGSTKKETSKPKGQG